MLASFKYLQETGYSGAVNTKGNGVKFDSGLKCGVIFCRSRDSLEWFRSQISEITNNGYKAYERDEVQFVNLKLYFPEGMELLPAKEYLQSILLHHPNMEDKSWRITNDYRRQQDGKQRQRCLIVTAPKSALDYIRSNGTETSSGSGTWKIDGPIFPIKITTAKPNELTSRFVQPQKELDFEHIPLPEITTLNVASPHQPPSLDFSQMSVRPEFVDWTADPNSTHGQDQNLSDDDDDDMDMAEVDQQEEVGTESDLQSRADALLGPSDQLEMTQVPPSKHYDKMRQRKNYSQVTRNSTPYKSQIICRLDKNTIIKNGK